MNDPFTPPPGLAPRFLPPPGWRWQEFTNMNGRRLRFGAVSPAEGAPRAIVVGLQGLSEFAEKYFETAQDMLDRGFTFYMMDWQGQGRSQRHLRNPQKRHARRFDDDAVDLDFFLKNHVLPHAVRPDGSNVPLVMLAHSMGANIGLRYLQDNPGIFSAAVFSAPLLGIYALRGYPRWLARFLTRGLGRLLGRSYVMGSGDWQADNERRNPPFLSSDPERGGVHRLWYLHAPELRVGNITYGWLDAACTSCRALTGRNGAAHLETPCLFVLAGRENLVDNAAAQAFAALMPRTQTQEIPESGHEILMESDAVRQRFFAAFDSFLVEHGVTAPLKQAGE